MLTLDHCGRVMVPATRMSGQWCDMAVLFFTLLANPATLISGRSLHGYNWARMYQSVTYRWHWLIYACVFAGAWSTTIFIIVSLKLLFSIIPGITPEASWTLTNVVFNMVSASGRCSARKAGLLLCRARRQQFLTFFLLGLNRATLSCFIGCKAFLSRTIKAPMMVLHCGNK